MSVAPGRSHSLSPAIVTAHLTLLALLSGFGQFHLGAHGRLIKVLANDTLIQFSDSQQWAGPLTFDWMAGADTPGVGGPNSSVCAMGDISRYATAEGASFRFSFRGLPLIQPASLSLTDSDAGTGVSAQLVLSSRPDHSAFSVDYDGRTFSGDTYSQVVGCGAAWTSPVGSVVEDHTITCTNHPVDERVYLEVLSILYDDGSDLPSATKSEPTTSTAPSPQNSRASSTKPVEGNGRTPNAPNPSHTTHVTGTSGGGVPSSGLGATSRTATGSSPSDTVTASIPPQHSAISSSVTSRGIAGIAVGAGLGFGILLCACVWLRRQYGSGRARRMVKPLDIPPVLMVEAELDKPTANPSPQRDSPSPRTSRLAEEDINRIAARMHALFSDQRIRHWRTGNPRPDSPETELPPY